METKKVHWGGDDYYSAPELEYRNCTGCHLRVTTGCDIASTKYDCESKNIIFLKKSLEDKTTDYLFEDQLRDLICQQAQKNRKIDSIHVDGWTVGGKPTGLRISYEYSSHD